MYCILDIKESLEINKLYQPLTASLLFQGTFYDQESQQRESCYMILDMMGKQSVCQVCRIKSDRNISSAICFSRLLAWPGKNSEPVLISLADSPTSPSSDRAALLLSDSSSVFSLLRFSEIPLSLVSRLCQPPVTLSRRQIGLSDREIIREQGELCSIYITWGEVRGEK